MINSQLRSTLSDHTGGAASYRPLSRQSVPPAKSAHGNPMAPLVGVSAPQAKEAMEETSKSVDPQSPVATIEDLEAEEVVSDTAQSDLHKSLFSVATYRTDSITPPSSDPQQRDLANNVVEKLKDFAIRYVKTAPVFGLVALMYVPSVNVRSVLQAAIADSTSVWYCSAL